MLDTVSKPVRIVLQVANYSVFMALIWYLSTSPSYRQLEDTEAMLAISFNHAGETVEPCRTLSAEELAALPPNMRKPTDCPRERSPLIIDVTLDGETIYNRTAEAPGLYKDGVINVFQSVKIPAGEHHIIVKMDDSVRAEGFEYILEESVSVKSAQILLVAFPNRDGFVLK